MPLPFNTMVWHSPLLLFCHNVLFCPFHSTGVFVHIDIRSMICRATALFFLTISQTSFQSRHTLYSKMPDPNQNLSSLEKLFSGFCVAGDAEVMLTESLLRSDLLNLRATSSTLANSDILNKLLKNPDRFNTASTAICTGHKDCQNGPATGHKLYYCTVCKKKPRQGLCYTHAYPIIRNRIGHRYGWPEDPASNAHNYPGLPWVGWPSKEDKDYPPEPFNQTVIRDYQRARLLVCHRSMKLCVSCSNQVRSGEAETPPSPTCDELYRARLALLVCETCDRQARRKESHHAIAESNRYKARHDSYARGTHKRQIRYLTTVETSIELPLSTICPRCECKHQVDIERDTLDCCIVCQSWKSFLEEERREG